MAELCVGCLLEKTLLVLECMGYALHFFCGCFWGCWHSSRLLLEKLLLVGGSIFHYCRNTKKMVFFVFLFFCFSVLFLFYFFLFLWEFTPRLSQTPPHPQQMGNLQQMPYSWRVPPASLRRGRQSWPAPRDCGKPCAPPRPPSSARSGASCPPWKEPAAPPWSCGP